MIQAMKNHNAELLQMLQKLVGNDTYSNIVLLLGGNNLYIPSREEANRIARNKAIKEKFYGGASYEEIAAEFNLSASHIRAIINKR